MSAERTYQLKGHSPKFLENFGVDADNWQDLLPTLLEMKLISLDGELESIHSFDQLFVSVSSENIQSLKAFGKFISVLKEGPLTPLSEEEQASLFVDFLNHVAAQAGNEVIVVAYPHMFDEDESFLAARENIKKFLAIAYSCLQSGFKHEKITSYFLRTLVNLPDEEVADLFNEMGTSKIDRRVKF